jgi:ABC-type Zn uptake system ZnuABC Zn-binding protein ZnuA
MRLFVASAASVALLALGAAGCGQKRVTECNGIIQVINTGVASLEKGPKIEGDPATGVADLKAMADSMDKVAGDAAKVELTIPELKKYSTDYQAMAKEVSKAARDMATAAEAKDVTKITSAQTAMEAAVKKEDPLVDSINKFCQQP